MREPFAMITPVENLGRRTPRQLANRVARSVTFVGHLDKGDPLGHDPLALQVLLRTLMRSMDVSMLLVEALSRCTVAVVTTVQVDTSGKHMIEFNLGSFPATSI